jgi:choline dehydrogenase
MLRGVSKYHGRGGPLNVTDLPSINQLTAAFIEAGVELGWSRNDDYDGASQDGFSTLQFTIRQGKRHSTADGYLHPAESRPNLTLWTETLATRVLFGYPVEVVRSCFAQEPWCMLYFIVALW